MKKVIFSAALMMPSISFAVARDVQMNELAIMAMPLLVLIPFFVFGWVALMFLGGGMKSYLSTSVGDKSPDEAKELKRVYSNRMKKPLKWGAIAWLFCLVMLFTNGFTMIPPMFQ